MVRTVLELRWARRVEEATEKAFLSLPSCSQSSENNQDGRMVLWGLEEPREDHLQKLRMFSLEGKTQTSWFPLNM